MKSVVITGSTRGIGFGLADAFLARGCRVVINGRTQVNVDRACAQLTDKYGAGKVYGFAALVSDAEQVEALWEFAKAQLERVDIWINNAGVSHDTEPLWEIAEVEARTVIDANILGTIYGAQVAIRGMKQQGEGQIYNMEGFGSSGHIRVGFSVYGTSKAAVRYLTKALVEETKDVRRKTYADSWPICTSLPFIPEMPVGTRGLDTEGQKGLTQVPVRFLTRL